MGDRQEENDALVCLATYPSEPEAQITRMHLEANDIAAVVSSDDCGSWEPWLQNSIGVRAMVRSQDIGRAMEVLQETRDNNP